MQAFSMMKAASEITKFLLARIHSGTFDSSHSANRYEKDFAFDPTALSSCSRPETVACSAYLAVTFAYLAVS